MDVSCEKGVRVLLHQPLNGVGLGPWQLEISFSFETPVSDIECRLWVDKGSDVPLERISLSPMA
jgi:hypothetical protein